MPILHSIIHRIDKGDGETPARLVPADAPLSPSTALDDLLAKLNDAYHGKAKNWGRFAEEPPAAFAAELAEYLAGERDFATLTRALAERLTPLIDDHLPVGGHLLAVDHRQGDARYLILALLHHREGFAIDESLGVVPDRQLNLAQMTLAARLDIGQWQAGSASHPYLSWTRDRGGKKLAEAFAETLGAREQRDAGEETRTLLKAFSDYVEHEDLPEEASREKTDALVDYASDQARLGEPITLEELSELVDEERPKAFYEHIRNSDYGLAPEIPPDKRTLNQFRRFTGRAAGVSISFDSHLLGAAVEYDEEGDRLIIKKVPNGLRDQLKRRQ
ncbi:nucleoid-associated protein YejK [Halomonas organivorans]|uniref:Nucleoid-associated protein n=1 Tax=Halomonas organivorans TaxID=257772 RepID=A0A7W5BVL4_9GAMM|nr:nucleoid-associated protein YejK [Halomonas organivorans]MBB3139972.1 nucleoid-associated protein [Halomonas organivorans]